MLSGYAYPNAELERFKLCNDWHTWLFFFDDQIDTDCGLGQNPALVRRHMEALMQVLRTGRTSSRPTPLELLTANIRDRLAEVASEAWLRRFEADVEDYLLKGTLQTAVHWRRGAPPELNAYTEQRIHDSAVLTCQDLSEITEPGLELPAAVLNDKTMRELRLLGARVVAFTNDVFSYVKEVLLHNNPNNLVHVIMTHRQCSRREAIAQSIHVINRDVEKFIERESLLPSWDVDTNACVQSYIAGLKAWMRGNYLWSLESGRYLEPMAQQSKTWSGSY